MANKATAAAQAAQAALPTAATVVITNAITTANAANTTPNANTNTTPTPTPTPPPFIPPFRHRHGHHHRQRQPRTMTVPPEYYMYTRGGRGGGGVQHTRVGTDAPAFTAILPPRFSSIWPTWLPGRALEPTAHSFPDSPRSTSPQRVSSGSRCRAAQGSAGGRRYGRS